MPLHDFAGPVTNNNTALFLKGKGMPATNNVAVARGSSLVKSINEAAGDDARWNAVTTWAGADDAKVVRFPAAIADLPAFYAPPNRLNVDVYDGDMQAAQVLGIAQTPDLDLTVDLFNPSDDAHAALAAVTPGTMLDVLVMTATSWKLTNTVHLDGTALECGGFAALVTAGRPYPALGPAGETAKLTVPLAFQAITAQRVIASY